MTSRETEAAETMVIMEGVSRNQIWVHPPAIPKLELIACGILKVFRKTLCSRPDVSTLLTNFVNMVRNVGFHINSDVTYLCEHRSLITFCHHFVSAMINKRGDQIRKWKHELQQDLAYIHTHAHSRDRVLHVMVLRMCYDVVSYVFDQEMV